MYDTNNRRIKRGQYIKIDNIPSVVRFTFGRLLFVREHGQKKVYRMCSNNMTSPIGNLEVISSYPISGK